MMMVWYRLLHYHNHNINFIHSEKADIKINNEKSEKLKTLIHFTRTRQRNEKQKALLHKEEKVNSIVSNLQSSSFWDKY